GPYVHVILNPDDNADEEFKWWANRYPDAKRLTTVFPRGGGSFRWTRKNPPNTVERSLALTGQTADSGRVFDVFYDIVARLFLPPNFILAGWGQAGIIAAYATMNKPAIIEEVVIFEPTVSHRDGPHFLNILRVCDIPEALGLLAPDVKLTLIGKNA